MIAAIEKPKKSQPAERGTHRAKCVDFDSRDDQFIEQQKGRRQTAYRVVDYADIDAGLGPFDKCGHDGFASRVVGYRKCFQPDPLLGNLNVRHHRFDERVGLDISASSCSTTQTVTGGNLPARSTSVVDGFEIGMHCGQDNYKVAKGYPAQKSAETRFLPDLIPRERKDCPKMRQTLRTLPSDRLGKGKPHFARWQDYTGERGTARWKCSRARQTGD